ncbi:MAG: hypothetical protein ACYDCQ_01910 [Dehalococcoidia bacterium]
MNYRNFVRGRLIWTALLAIGLACLGQVGVARAVNSTATATFSIQPPAANVPAGGTVTVTLQLDATTPGVGSFDTHVTYNAAVLTPTACTTVQLINFTAFCNITFASGIVDETAADGGNPPAAIIGTNTQMTITFMAIGASGTSSVIGVLQNAPPTDPNTATITAVTNTPGLITVTPGAPATAPTKTCNPTNPATGASTVCTLTTTSALANTGTITDTVTSPAAATITNCTSAALTCGAPAANAVTVTCTNAGGCAAGATFQLTITSANAGALTESVAVTPPAGGAATTFTVTANPATSFVTPVATAPTKTCNPTNPATGASTVCTVTTTSALANTGTIVDTVTGPTGATITACGSTTGGLSCGTPTAGANNSVTVTCTTVAGCPAGATFQVTITSATAGALTESAAVTPPGGGAATTFAVVAVPAVAFFAPGGPPLFSAIGCANANVNTSIQFPTQPNILGGFVVSSSNQIPNAFTTASGNAQLSVLAPQGLGNGFGGAFLDTVLCGAVFQDADANPNTIDGGTITFALGANGQTTNGLSIGQILESNGQVSAGIPCGDTTVQSCQGANTVSLSTGAPCVTAVTLDCVAEPTASRSSAASPRH